MQPTPNQTVPATSSLPAQGAARQPAANIPAPLPLDADVLRQIGGGVTPGLGW